jgi:hypothetical protein
MPKGVGEDRAVAVDAFSTIPIGRAFSGSCQAVNSPFLS